MRSLRWLLLVIIAVVAAGVFQVYRLQRIAGRAAQRPAPPMMALGDKANAEKWQYTQSTNAKPVIRMSAEDYSLSSDAKKPPA